MRNEIKLNWNNCIKCLSFLLSFIIFISLSNAAEDYNSDSSLILNLSLDSSIELNYKGKDASVSYVNVDLLYFPREEDRIKIIEFSKYANGAKVNKGDVLNYKWNYPESKELKFGLRSLVRVDNKISKLYNKIKFPIELEEEYLEYTKETKFIDINDEIRKKASSIIGDEDDLYSVVFKLADWTKNNIKYDLNTLTVDAVQKSSWVLRNKEGVCDEITNLFISFLRSVGIPARFVSGEVYSSLSGDWGGHGWAEVYFPGYGWVPFDVTFGQYGWIDASHIKLADNLDSGDPSVKYTWMANDAELDFDELDIKVRLVARLGNVEDGILLSVEPLFKEASFGSYIPVKVRLENLRNYYISESVYVSNAPGLVGGNVKEVLLKPNEVKEIYWILEIPKNLDRYYIYKSSIIVKDSFGSSDSSLIEYSSEHENKLNLDEARSMVGRWEKREEKEYLTEVELECNAEKEFYYSNEEIIVNCNVKNKFKNELNGEICLKNECRNLMLKGLEAKKINFQVKQEKTEKLRVSVESEMGIVYEYLKLSVIKVAEVYVSDLKPERVNYNEKVNISFMINPNSMLKDVNVEVGSFGVLKINEIKDSKKINILVNGKDLVYPLKFKIKYEDVNGKVYSKEEEFKIIVENIPWYGKISAWFSGLV